MLVKLTGLLPKCFGTLCSSNFRQWSLWSFFLQPWKELAQCHSIFDLNHAQIPAADNSVVISRPWSRDSSALKFILSRSWSRDLKAQVSALVSRPEVQGLGLGLETEDHIFFSCGAFLCALTVLVWDQKFCWNLCMLSATCTWCRQSTWFLGVNQLWTLGLYFQLICKQSTDWTDVTLLG